MDFVTFRLLRTQNVHWSVSEIIAPAVVVDLLDGNGNAISAGNRPKAGIVREDERQLDAGLYSIRIGFAQRTRPAPTSYKVAISGGPDWGIVPAKDATSRDDPAVSSRFGRVQHVGLLTYDGSAIQDGAASWIVIHGRSDSPYGSSIFKLATAVNGAESTVPQVLLIDWETGAGDNEPEGIGLQGRHWIKGVAKFLSSRLAGHQITGNKLSLAGHSWGSYVARQTAFDLQGQVQRLVALDPAFGPGSLGIGQTNESSRPDYFASVAVRSWAIWGTNWRGIPYGNEDATLTAHDSFAFITPIDFGSLDNHRAPVETWANMIQNVRDNVATDSERKFYPDKVTGGTWTANQCKLPFLMLQGVVRTPDQSATKFDSQYPFEGVLTLDVKEEAEALLPAP